jgi:hypothetical protein
VLSLSARRNLFPYYNPDLTALATHFSPFPPHLGCRIVHPRKRIASGLDLAYLKEHRGRYRPSPSIWTRVLGSVPHLGVADTVEDLISSVAVTVLEDLLPSVAVAVEDLRPRAKYVQITLAAVKDIRFCEQLFDNWMTELDECVANRISRPRVPSNDNNGFTES